MEPIRFTQGKDGAVYAFVMAVPEPGEIIRIQSMGTNTQLLDKPITTVTLLGSDAKLKWEQTPVGLKIKCPSKLSRLYAVFFPDCIKIQIRYSL
jgi:alpha-L-fucosidase